MITGDMRPLQARDLLAVHDLGLDMDLAMWPLKLEIASIDWYYEAPPVHVSLFGNHCTTIHEFGLDNPVFIEHYNYAATVLNLKSLGFRIADVEGHRRPCCNMSVSQGVTAHVFFGHVVWIDNGSVRKLQLEDITRPEVLDELLTPHNLGSYRMFGSRVDYGLPWDPQSVLLPDNVDTTHHIKRNWDHFWIRAYGRFSIRRVYNLQAGVLSHKGRIIPTQEPKAVKLLKQTHF